MWMVPLKSFAEHDRVKIKVVMKALLSKTFPLSRNCFKSIWKYTAFKNTDLPDPSTNQEVSKKRPCTSTCMKIICRTLRISPCTHRSTNSKLATAISKKPVTCIVIRKNCINKTKYVYPGGFYQPTESIFETLGKYDVYIREEDRTFPWFICYDFEALLTQVNERATDMLEWNQKHEAISVSVCSNVEGFTDPVCIVDGNHDVLVSKMVEIMSEIALRVYKLAEEWGWVLDTINDKVKENEDEEDDVFERRII